MPTGPGTTGGFTCSACGGWVAWGSTHQCPHVSPTPTVTWDRTGEVIEQLKRIADALERMAGIE